MTKTDVSRGSDTVRVLFTPFYEENPYQEMYEEALQSEEIVVCRHKDPIPFSPLSLRAILNQVDVIHLHWLHPFFLFGSKRWFYDVPGSKVISILAAAFFILQIYLLSLTSIKIIWTVHNITNHENRYLKIDRWVNNSVAKYVDYVQAWDDTTEKAIQTRFNIPSARIVKIPHGNYTPRYNDRGSVSKEIPLDVSSFSRVFFHFGMVRPYKNVPQLIQTFDEVASDEDCLLIAGNPIDDVMRMNVEQAASDCDNVLLDLRYIPDEEVPSYFERADVCVFPYEDIFNSGSVLLAMTFGKPVIAPKKGSIPSVLHDKNYLYEDLENALIKASCTDTADLEVIGAENKRASVRNHNWEDIAIQTKRIYE